MSIGFYGSGAMAREIAEVLTSHGHSIVAAYDLRQPDAPLDAVFVDTVDALIAAGPEVVIHATPRDGDLKAELLELIAGGCNVVSISGIAHLDAVDSETAELLDRAARDRGVRVIGTGLNPGFVLDLVPIFFAGACVAVDAITARRTMDLSSYGPAVQAMYGIGLTEEEFRASVEDDSIGLHREIVQSIHMVADALGLQVEAVEEEKLPILEGGRTVGFRHICRAPPSIEMEVQGAVSLEADTATTVWIKGDPDVTVTMSDGLSNRGGRVVAARVLHLLPWLVEASPGLRSPVELPLALGRSA